MSFSRDQISHFSRFEEKRNAMILITHVRALFERKRDSSSLSLSANKSTLNLQSASHKAQKKRSQYVPLTRLNLLRINDAYEREKGKTRSATLTQTKTLKTKKRQLICAQSLCLIIYCLPTDAPRNNTTNESFTRQRAARVIAGE